MPPPSQYWHWLHQTYEMQWKGTVVKTTVEGEEHSAQKPHWIASMQAAGAVVLDKKNSEWIQQQQQQQRGGWVQQQQHDQHDFTRG